MKNGSKGLWGICQWELKVWNTYPKEELCHEFGSCITYINMDILFSIDEEKLKILYEPSQRLTEGGNVTICCISKRLLPREYLRWFEKGNIIRKEVNETCLLLTNVDRNDYTTFVCLAEEGTAIKQATVNIFCKFL